MASEIRANLITSRAGLSTVTMTDSGPMFSGITTFVDNSGFTFGVGGGTSIFTPATNILTLGTNNTEKVRIDANGNANITGVTTAANFKTGVSNLHNAGLTLSGGQLDVGSNIKIGTAGVVTATSFSGSGANLTGITGTTINNNANNRIVTGSGTANTLEAETSLEWDGTNTLTVVHPSSYQDFIVRTSAGGGGFELFRAGNGPFRIRSSSTSPSSDADELVIGATNATRGLTIFGATNNIFFGDDSDNDIGKIQYVHSDNSMRFTTNTAERLRIDSSGNVMMGVTSSSNRFHVEGTTTGSRFGVDDSASGITALAITNEVNADLETVIYTNKVSLGSSVNIPICFHTNGKANEKLRIATDGSLTVSSTTDGTLNLTTTDSRGSFIRFQESGTSKCFVGSGQGLSLGTANDLGLRATTHIRMRSGAEEHAMLTDEGFFAAKGMAGNWVSNQSPASTLSHQFNNTGVSKWVCQFEQEHHAGFGVQILGNSTANSEAFVIYANSNNTTRFRVLWDGSVGSANNSYGGISDIKLKENIVDANSQWNDIKAVKVRNFNFKDTPDTKMLGVVAQEIETISPGLISEIVDKDPNTNESLGTTTKEVKYSILYMKAIKALQEAITRIETLEQDNIALRARVTNLEGN